MRFLAALLLIGTLGCVTKPDEGLICTEIGCEDLLTLSFETADGQPVTSFHGSVEIEGKRTEISCTPESKFETEYECIGSKLVLRTSADLIHLNLRNTDQDSVGIQNSIEPTYLSVQPNGEGCPPVCQQATMVIQFSQLNTTF